MPVAMNNKGMTFIVSGFTQVSCFPQSRDFIRFDLDVEPYKWTDGNGSVQKLEWITANIAVTRFTKMIEGLAQWYLYSEDTSTLKLVYDGTTFEFPTRHMSRRFIEHCNEILHTL